MSRPAERERRPGERAARFAAMTALAALALAFPRPEAASACAGSVLDWIATLERTSAEQGGREYASLADRDATSPNVTRMTVDQVIAWQSGAARTNLAGTAAGRYQITRTTLARMVAEGKIPGSARFDRGTQDAIALQILREAGWTANGATTPATANHVAATWGPFPAIDPNRPPGEQRRGIYGNIALVDGETFMNILNCQPVPRDTLREIDELLSGNYRNVDLDTVLKGARSAMNGMMASLADAVLGVLLFLFAIDLVWLAGRWIMRGSFGDMATGLVFRLLFVTMCLVVLVQPGAVLGGIDAAARRLAGPDVGETLRTFSPQEFAANGFAIILALFEHARDRLSFLEEIAFALPLGLIFILIALTLAAQLAIIVFWLLKIAFVGIAGLVALGLGGLKATESHPENWIRALLGAWAGAIGLMLIAGTIGELAWKAASIDALFDTLDAFAAPLLVLMLQIIGVVAMYHLPKMTEDIFHGSAIQVSVPSLGGKAKKTFDKGAKGAVAGPASAAVGGAGIPGGKK